MESNIAKERKETTRMKRANLFITKPLSWCRVGIMIVAILRNCLNGYQIGTIHLPRYKSSDSNTKNFRKRNLGIRIVPSSSSSRIYLINRGSVDDHELLKKSTPRQPKGLLETLSFQFNAKLSESAFNIQTSALSSTKTNTIEKVSSSLRLSPWEAWCMKAIEENYDKALRIKCPFFRRRASDMLDSFDMIIRFLAIRHKTLLPPPAGWKLPNHGNEKLINLSIHDVYNILLSDWCTITNKGYYITGRLNTTIFRDDCFFDGPDPDMPVRGLRKYLNAASQLFYHSESYAQLLSLQIVDDNDNHQSDTNNDNRIFNNNNNKINSKKVIIATWKMAGVLKLPWKPTVPTIHGTTIYMLDENNLIYQHIESWEESMLTAFIQTFFPHIYQKFTLLKEG